MQRTQISLTDDERRALDVVSARTGRSISSLIRAAVDAVYGDERSMEDDLSDMRHAFGSWADRETDSEELVEHLRSGRRIGHAR